MIYPSLIVATFLASSTERPGPSHELLKGTPASTNPLFRSGHSEHNAAVATPVMMRGGTPPLPISFYGCNVSVMLLAPREVCEGAVGLGHAMGVFLFLEGGSGLIDCVYDLGRQALFIRHAATSASRLH